MPVLTIPVETREWLAKHAAKEHEVPNENRCFTLRDLHQEQEAGFFAALRCLLPSEVVGLLVCDADDAREGKPLLSESFPGIVY